MAAEPKTLQDAILYFADANNCLNYLAARRWPSGVVCPRCGSTDVGFVASRRIWQCKTRHDHAQFSIKTGSIFEDSPITLDKWLLAMWMLANCKNGVSSYEISRATGISQKSTWFMLQRIRLSMQDESTGGKLSGEVEVDETFIGGKARNMHKDVKARRITGTGPEGKAIVAAVLERGGKVRAKVVDKRRKPQLQAMVREHVEPKSALYSDALKSYEGLSEEYKHQVIDHAVEYVRENVHTNGLENFWSFLKRGINGTYISVEPFHLFRYVDEQAAALLTVSADTVYDLLKSGQLPGRKVGRKWLTTRGSVMRWVEESLAADTAQRAIDAGDKVALAKALQSGAVRVRTG